MQSQSVLWLVGSIAGFDAVMNARFAVGANGFNFSITRHGCEEATQSGELAGYPVVDVKVRLLDGQAHEVDSSERSFKIAGSLAMREALREGRPVLLEPLVSVEVGRASCRERVSRYV